MDTITKLRELCQKPKVSDREDIGMSYQDIKSKLELGISIYFTWFFLRFNISANTVTYISGLCAIVGGFFLSLESLVYPFIGLFFLELYNILDYCDGEISRYYKKGSIKGWFLDWYMLFVRDAAMFGGMAILANKLYPSQLTLICSVISVVIPFLDKSIIGCTWTVISWQRLVEIQDSKLVNFLEKNNGGEEQNNQADKSKSIVMRFIKIVWSFSIAIFQHHWSLLIVFLIFLTQMAISNLFYIDFNIIPYFIMYIGIYGPIYVIIRLWRALKEDSFNYKYELLFKKKKNVSANDYII